MNISEILYFSKRSIGPSGLRVNSKSIRDFKLKDLIDELEKTGVIINLADSEQDIKYKILGVEKEVTVPLQASFEDDVSVVGYHLRNRLLYIGIRDFHKSSGFSKGRLGGQVSRQDGIQCSLVFNGSNNYLNSFESAKNVLEKFYNNSKSLIK